MNRKQLHSALIDSSKKALFYTTVSLLICFGSLAHSQSISNQIIARFEPGVVIIDSLGAVTITHWGIDSIFQVHPYSAFIKAFPTFDPADTLMNTWDGRIIRTPDWSDVYRITLENANLRDSIISLLVSFEATVYAERNIPVYRRIVDQNHGMYENIFSHLSLSNGSIKRTLTGDPLWNQQWSLSDQGVLRSDIHAEEAWEISTGNSSTTIAVCDNYLDIAHPDLVGRVLPQFGVDNTDYASHANQCAGIIGASADNNEGISGIDHEASLIGFQMAGDAISAALAVRSAYKAGVHIMNNSWGEDGLLESPNITIANEFSTAYKANVVSVNAMPEYGHPSDFPNQYGHGILNVGATTNLGVAAWYYQVEPRNYVDLCAPGGAGASGHPEWDILTTDRFGGTPGPDGNYTSVAGTSFSAPHATGVCGLLRGASLSNARNAELDVEDYIQILRRTTSAHFDPFPVAGIYGKGILNADNVVQAVVPNSGSPNRELRHVQDPARGGTISLVQQNILVSTALPRGNEFRWDGGFHSAFLYRVERTVTFPDVYYPAPQVWGRGHGSIGVDKKQWPQLGEMYCEVIDSTITETSALMATYVFLVDVLRTYRLPLGIFSTYHDFVWVPCPPDQVMFAYSILSEGGLYTGTPSLAIGGPECAVFKKPVTYFATSTGMQPPFSYQWRIEIPTNSGQWIPLGSHQGQSLVPTFMGDATLECTIFSPTVPGGVSTSKAVISAYNCPAPDLEIPHSEVKASGAPVTIDGIYPNPVRDKSQLEISVHFSDQTDNALFPTHVSLTDILGRTVTTLFDGALSSGTHLIEIDAHNLSSGLYLCNARSSTSSATKVIRVVR